jgi:hypothetical protein
MEINTDITKTLVVSKEPIRCKLVVNDRPIEQVRRLYCLRSEGDLKSEVLKQVSKAGSISGSIEASSMEKQEYEYKQ